MALFVIFIAVILIRTLMFTPKDTGAKEFEEIDFDRGKAVDNLRELVMCRTISYRDHELEDDAEFEKLIGKLPTLYPHVFEKCEFRRFPDRGILFTWKGQEAGEPSILMAHYDVVPVNEEMWDKDPFAGIIEDGVLWGRGTIDTKPTFNGALTAADHLIAQGFTPKNDIYMAFSGGEEISGKGAENIVDYFYEQGITPAMVVDEGGAVVEGVFPGVQGPCGMVGIAEKGLMNIAYTVNANGGHASSPAAHTPIGILSEACTRVENNPCKAHFTKPVLDMFDTLGRHSTFVYRMIFANLWCFGWLLDNLFKKTGGQLNALIRTTVAFTQMFGSKAENVIPPTASMVSNIRINPEDSVASVQEYLKKVINDDRVEISITDDADEPSPISRTDCEGYERVKTAIEGTWRGAIVTPYLMVQCSDSRHYAKISDKVYRFSAQDMTSEEMNMIHGNNERIRLEAAQRAVEFYIRLIKQC